MGADASDDTSVEAAVALPCQSKEDTPLPSYSNHKHSPTVTPPGAAKPSCLQTVASADRSSSATAHFLNAKKYIQDVGVTSENAATPVSLLASAAPRESAATSIHHQTTRVAEEASGASSGQSALSPILQPPFNVGESCKPSEFAPHEEETPPGGQTVHVSSPSRRAPAPPETAQYEGAQTWSDIVMRQAQATTKAERVRPPAAPSNPCSDMERRRHEVPPDARASTSTGERSVQVDPQAAHGGSGAPQPPYRHPHRAPSDPCKTTERPHGVAAVSHDATARPSHGRFENVRTWVDSSEKWLQPGVSAARHSPPAAGPRPAKVDALAQATWCPDRNPPRGPPDPCRGRERPYSTPEVGMSSSPLTLLCIYIHVCV